MGNRALQSDRFLKFRFSRPEVVFPPPLGSGLDREERNDQRHFCGTPAQLASVALFFFFSPPRTASAFSRHFPVPCVGGLERAEDGPAGGGGRRTIRGAGQASRRGVDTVPLEPNVVSYSSTHTAPSSQRNHPTFFSKFLRGGGGRARPLPGQSTPLASGSRSSPIRLETRTTVAAKSQELVICFDFLSSTLSVLQVFFLLGPWFLVAEHRRWN